MDRPALPQAWATRVPILNAPMGGVAGGRLAAAVSAAGGLGMIGQGSTGSATSLAREIALLDRTEHFGIGLVDWVMRREPALWRTALAAGPRAISVSFGDDLGWVAEARSVGASTITQVFDVDGARRAEDAGIDVVVARGLEGGGHGVPRRSRDELLRDVVAAVDLPVLAAGAISCRDDVVDVLRAGAAAAWIGTAFAACDESLTTPGQRAAMLAASAQDTVLTRTVDVALGYPWSSHHPSRVIDNDFSRRWQGRETELAGDRLARAELVEAMASDDTTTAPVDAGTGVGSIVEVRSAAHVMAALSPRSMPPAQRGT